MIKKYPFYLKTTVILLGLFLITYILYCLRPILVPLAFALLLSVLLNPLTALFERWGLKRVLAISLAILIALIAILAIGYFLFMEVRNFSNHWSVFKDKLDDLMSQLQHHARKDLGVTARKQNEYLTSLENSLKPVLATAMGSLMGVLGMLVLLPVYSFLFLFYKKLILNFLYEIFADSDEQLVGSVLTETKGAIQHYMFGLVLEAAVVSILNSVALFIIGVKYAVILGVLGALLNVLPFIGGIIAVLLPMLVAIVTGEGFQTQLWIVIAYLIIQFIDNHFLMPYIVASKVRINALVSIVAVLLGAALWGISGMFLSIPVIGVLKIIFDRLPEMKPWGRLIGVEVSARRPLKALLRKTRKQTG
jgi:predicted PurR-regulated permease PerM